MEDKKFDAIKTDVPEEVIDILNLSELNIQPQHQSYFLLNDSAGEVSKKLNIITGLDIIDHLFSRINSEIHVINTEIKINEKEVASLDEKIKELSYLDDAFVKYERLEEEAEEYKEMVEDKNILENRIQAYRKIDLEKKSTEKTLKLEQTVKELASMVEEYTSLEKNKAKLESLWTKYNNNTWCIDKLDKEIKSFQKKYNETIRNNPICPLLNIECKELKNYDK
jgi:DNA repair exonuclease SbcCD ATPase subunit